MTVAILFGSFFLLMLIGVPIAISLGISSLITIILGTNLQTNIIIQNGFYSLNDFTLLAIPLFITAGVLMGSGGISKRLLNLANVLIGYIAGGLAMVTVLASMFFAAISGSGPATVAAIGSFMIPDMKKNNYPASFATALTAAAGSIGVIIPPSIPFVMFGVVGSVSIGSLFLAGIVPGIVMGLCLIAVSFALAKKNNYVGTGSPPKIKDVLKALNEAKFALLVPVIVLGGIYTGVFSPTESAAVAVVYALIIGVLVYREISLKDIYKVFASAALSSTVTLIIIGFSVSFAYLMTREKIPTILTEFITGISDSPTVILLLILLLLLIVGMFIDAISSVVVLTPILLPITTSIGIDPVHFGVIMVTALAIGYVTPPLGVNLFVASGIGNVSFEKVSLAVIPFLIILVVALLIISFIPGLSLFIPNLAN